MIVKDFIKLLEKLEKDREIKLASDEEWNTVFNKVELQYDIDHDVYIIFGLSGSEAKEYQI